MKANIRIKTQTGADLAGACEGEDIAYLIDLARTIRDENGTHSAQAAKILLQIQGRTIIWRAK